MPTLAFNHLSYTYPGADNPALTDLTLNLADGASLAIIGPSGCGKSTLLQLAAGLIQPTAGTLTIDGAPLLAPRRQTAFILQNHGLLPWKTALENAALGLIIAGTPRITAFQRAQTALTRLGLADFVQAWPRELSGGQIQRVALARALAADCDLLLADEALSALDALAREDLQQLLLQLWREQGYTQVLVTHDVDEAAFLGQRVLVMTPCSRPTHPSTLLDNPYMGQRDSDGFVALTRQLRELLKPCPHEDEQ
ncbi:MAG: ATP-binding cassette domain-containing protein [Actinomycetes bacterium]|jgi:NitT/TauT family transport system ATP-binding protein|nr:ATP-binding cassette domain-containing protein [Actinomycetes bacterium]